MENDEQPERLYTLEEARALERAKSCMVYGHSWSTIMSDEGPKAIRCEDCGIGFRLVDVTTHITFKRKWCEEPSPHGDHVWDYEGPAYWCSGEKPSAD